MKCQGCPQGVARVHDLELCVASLTARCAQLEAKLHLQSGPGSPPSTFSTRLESSVEEAAAEASPHGALNDH